MIIGTYDVFVERSAFHLLRHMMYSRIPSNVKIQLKAEWQDITQNFVRFYPIFTYFTRNLMRS